MRARKSDEVLFAARDVFLERGFEATTMDDIATRAHVSKATVYSNFHDKDALLTAMIDRVTFESAQILASVADVQDNEGTLEERLIRIGRTLAGGVLNPDIVRLRRLAISAASAFPASSVLYWQRGPAAAIKLLERRLGALVAGGELDIPDIPVTAAQFAYALIGPLQDRALFDIEFAPNKADLDRHVRTAVRALMLASQT